MPEYMDYNDVEIGYKSKKHKIFSSIRFYISIIFLLFIVIWTFTHLPENVRTKFGPVYSSAHKVGEQKVKSRNAFLEFNSAFSVDEKVNVDKEFKSGRFDAILKLTQVSKLDLAKDKIDTFNIGDTFVVVKTYEVERQKNANGSYYDENSDKIIGTLGFDVLIFKFDTTEGLVIEKPERFSIRYHNKINQLVPTIEKVYVNNESFRLNFYSLSVVAESKNGIDNVKTTLNLSEGINKQEYENQTFVKNQFVKTKENKDLIKTILTEDGNRGDRKVCNTITLNQNATYAEIGINFNDNLYNKFLNFKVETEKQVTYKIKVN